LQAVALHNDAGKGTVGQLHDSAVVRGRQQACSLGSRHWGSPWANQP
jgi:hypothetical protein